MIGGILFLIIEFKLNTPDANALAQLFLALLCAWFLFAHDCAVLKLYPAAAEENKKITFDKLRVYGLLTNAVVFDFHSYDPITKQFCFDERMLISPVRSDALAGMVNGAYFFFFPIFTQS